MLENIKLYVSKVFKINNYTKHFFLNSANSHKPGQRPNLA